MPPDVFFSLIFYKLILRGAFRTIAPTDLTKPGQPLLREQARCPPYPPLQACLRASGLRQEERTTPLMVNESVSDKVRPPALAPRRLTGMVHNSWLEERMSSLRGEMRSCPPHDLEASLIYMAVSLSWWSARADQEVDLRSSASKQDRLPRREPAVLSSLPGMLTCRPSHPPPPSSSPPRPHNKRRVVHRLNPSPCED